MSLVLDVYCKSKAHLSEQFRDAVCKKWDQEHPDLAPKRDAASDDQPRETDQQESRPRRQESPPPAAAPPPPAAREQRPTPARASPNVGATPTANAAAAAAAANSTTNPFLASGPNPSPIPTGDVGAASVDPFQGIQAESQTSADTVSGGGGINQTVMIVSSVVAALFAVMLVGAFVMYRLKKKRTLKEASEKRGSNGLENGIFDAVPRANPKADFTIEDFAAAPNGLYEDDEHGAVNKKPQIPKITTQLSDQPAASAPLTPWGSKSGNEVGSGVIFSSPYEHADTEYHITENHVFGTPMYVVPRVGVAGINLTTPNAAAVAQNAQSSAPGHPRHSMEWPAEFDDDPLNPEFGFEIPYGANTAAVDMVEEFPDVPTFQTK